MDFFFILFLSEVLAINYSPFPSLPRPFARYTRTTRKTFREEKRNFSRETPIGDSIQCLIVSLSFLTHNIPPCPQTFPSRPIHPKESHKGERFEPLLSSRPHPFAYQQSRKIINFQGDSLTGEWRRFHTCRSSTTRKKTQIKTRFRLYQSLLVLRNTSRPGTRAKCQDEEAILLFWDFFDLFSCSKHFQFSNKSDKNP